MNLDSVSAATASPEFEDVLAFVREHAGEACLSSGERLVDHAAGTVALMRTLNVDPQAVRAAALFALTPHLSDPETEIAQRFGEEVARLVTDVRKLLRLGTVSLMAAKQVPEGNRDAQAERRAQIEALRKMLLAFAQDIRVVVIRLASRLQSLRYYAAAKIEPPPDVARETLEIYAPLANRLGIWQLKWELEDLAFRFEDPVTYKRIAKLLDEKRVEREAYVTQAIARLEQELAAAQIPAEVSGRPKHIYSIWRKMRGKELDFSELYDVRAFRVIVPDIKDCYAVLGIVHHLWQPVPREFDDYISRPKPNGYKSLHTVVIGDDGRAFEVQIRTQEMHRFAEYGVAAHWRYKEAGTRGYGGQFSASDKYDEKIAWLRQLLAWKDEIADGSSESAGNEAWAQLRETSLDDDHIYVLTPQARCDRAAARRDGRRFCLSPAQRAGAPLPRRARRRRDGAAQHAAGERADGGDRRGQGGRALARLVEPAARLPAERPGAAEGACLVQPDRPAGNHHARPRAGGKDLAARGQDLGEPRQPGRAAWVQGARGAVRGGRQGRVQPAQYRAGAVRCAAARARDRGARAVREAQQRGASVAHGASTGVLVVGVDALLTQLARCCRPAPPDPISGFVTRGKGMSIHRSDCATFRRMSERAPERVLQTTWSADVLGGRGASVYPVDLMIDASDRQGLLRDISEVFAREKMNVIGVKTQSRRNAAVMQFTVEVSNSAQVQRACTLLGEVPGVVRASRKT